MDGKEPNNILDVHIFFNFLLEQGYLKIMNNSTSFKEFVNAKSLMKKLEASLKQNCGGILDTLIV